jgi:hypothetical protein
MSLIKVIRFMTTSSYNMFLYGQFITTLRSVLIIYFYF